VTIAEPLDVVAHRAAFERAQTEIRLSGPPIAPIRQGDRIGDLVITLEGQEPIIAPVLAAEDVARLGFLGRAIEGLRVMMSGSNG
jgi:D-alanyl-D-alanine carboxypeptidase (penicillin-binding protein 5/6)